MMMVNLLAYPLRLGSTGSFETIEDLTEPYLAQEIALMILTEPGERPLVPEYGLDSTDEPDSISELELNSKLEMFRVPAHVTSVEKVLDPDVGELRVAVSFEPQRATFVPTNTEGRAPGIVQPHETVETY